jgi:hypothetical protein
MFKNRPWSPGRGAVSAENDAANRRRIVMPKCAMCKEDVDEVTVVKLHGFILRPKGHSLGVKCRILGYL